MITWMLLPALALLFALALLLSWGAERRRLHRLFTRPLVRRWSEEWRKLSGPALKLDEEWRELGYEPLGTLLGAEKGVDGFPLLAVYRHPDLPIYGLTEVRDEKAIPFALTFWEGGGVLITTAAAARDARAAAVDTGLPRLVQLRVGGRPLALDGQHVGTVRAWALGKRSALPATREALLGYLAEDHERLRNTLERGDPLPLGEYLRSLVGRPERILTF